MPANLPYLANQKFHFPLNQYREACLPGTGIPGKEYSDMMISGISLLKKMVKCS
jgi:hypothetical protein